MRYKLLSVFVDKIVCGAKTVPQDVELHCFSGLLEAITTEEVEKCLLQPGIKMIKRSPEVAMRIVNFALSRISADISGSSETLIPLIVQQSKHAKETVRKLTAESTFWICRKTTDISVLREYVRAMTSILVAKGTDKLKSPQERASVVMVVASIGVAIQQEMKSIGEIAEETSNILASLFENEIADEVKIALLQALGEWCLLGSGFQEIIPSIVAKAPKEKETVQRALLSMLGATIKKLRNVKDVDSLIEYLSKVILDGCQKAAMRWDAVLAYECIVFLPGYPIAFEKTDAIKAIEKSKNVLFSSDLVGKLSELDVPRYLEIACAAVLKSEDISCHEMRGAVAETITLASLHHNTEIRKKSLECLKTLSGTGDAVMIESLVDSIHHWASNAASLTGIVCNTGDDPIFNNLAIHEHFLSSLICSLLLRNAEIVKTSVAMKACILAHHRMVSGSRGRYGAWQCIISAMPSIKKVVEEDPKSTMDILFSKEWGIRSKDVEVQDAALCAVTSLSAMSCPLVVDSFLEQLNPILSTVDHDSLSAKQLRIYATKFGQLSNQAEDGGMIPSELMENILADKSSIQSPSFPPSLMYATSFMEELENDDDLKKKVKSDKAKQDAAAIARREQLIAEARTRVEVVQIRETLSLGLRALGNFAVGDAKYTEDHLQIFSEPCLQLLASPLVGEPYAFECLDNVISCIHGILGHQHLNLSASFNLVVASEARRRGEQRPLLSDQHIVDSVCTLVKATGGLPPSDEVDARRGYEPLSDSLYSFFFPIVRSAVK